MKNRRALFIDDEATYEGGGVCPYMDMLRDWGYIVQCEENPGRGMDAVKNYRFDLVFVDYRFNNSDQTGADIGRFLRSKYPLLELILMTGLLRQREAIDDYATAIDWDATFEKEPDGIEAHESEANLRMTLRKASEHAKGRLPRWNEDEEQYIRQRLDALEVVCQNNAWLRKTTISAHEIALAANAVWALCDLKDGERVDENLSVMDVKLLADYRAPGAANEAVQRLWESEAIRRGRKIPSIRSSRSSWTQIFTIGNTCGKENSTRVPNLKALITRDLILRNPGRWTTAASKFGSLETLVEEFGLERFALGKDI